MMEKPDIVYVDSFVYKAIKNIPRTITYIHEPVASNQLVYNIHKQKNSFYVSAYGYMYQSLINQISNPQLADVVVCNSKWSAQLYRKYFGKDALVVHPPVATGSFFPSVKENLVTCVGVFNPRKNYEKVITAVANAASKPTLRIVGTSSPSYFWYLLYLKKLAKDLGAENRIHLHVNSSFSELKSIVGRSRFVFLAVWNILELLLSNKCLQVAFLLFTNLLHRGLIYLNMESMVTDFEQQLSYKS